jgi:hypothetical protein
MQIRIGVCPEAYQGAHPSAQYPEDGGTYVGSVIKEIMMSHANTSLMKAHQEA